MKTKIIHHINRDFTHEVVETITTLFGFVIKRELTSNLIYEN